MTTDDLRFALRLACSKLDVRLHQNTLKALANRMIVELKDQNALSPECLEEIRLQ